MMAQELKSKTQVVEVPTKAPKVDAKLVTTTIVYLVAIVNSIAALFGFDLDITANSNTIYEGASLVFGLGTFLFGVWKNNNFSKRARIKEHAAKQVDPKKNTKA
jgi:SPP1 family holin